MATIEAGEMLDLPNLLLPRLFRGPGQDLRKRYLLTYLGLQGLCQSKKAPLACCHLAPPLGLSHLLLGHLRVHDGLVLLNGDVRLSPEAIAGQE